MAKKTKTKGTAMPKGPHMMPDGKKMGYPKGKKAKGC